MSPQDENAICFEGRFVGREDTPIIILKCSAVAVHKAEYSTRTVTDGSAMRSMLVEPSLFAISVPSNAIDTKRETGPKSSASKSLLGRRSCALFPTRLRWHALHAGRLRDVPAQKAGRQVSCSQG